MQTRPGIASNDRLGTPIARGPVPAGIIGAGLREGSVGRRTASRTFPLLSYRRDGTLTEALPELAPA